MLVKTKLKRTKRLIIINTTDTRRESRRSVDSIFNSVFLLFRSGLNETKFPGFEYFGHTENSNRSCPRALCFHLTLTTNPHGMFDRYSSNVRSSVKVSRGRSVKSWGLRASVSFLPVSSPPPPFFRSCPISRASKNKKIGFLVQKTPRKRLLRRLPSGELRHILGSNVAGHIILLFNCSVKIRHAGTIFCLRNIFILITVNI